MLRYIPAIAYRLRCTSRTGAGLCEHRCARAMQLFPTFSGMCAVFDRGMLASFDIYAETAYTQAM